MGERELEVELKEKDEIIMSLRLNEHLLKDKLEISRRNMGKQLERIKELEKKNEQLRKELDNFRPVMFQDMRKGTVILYSKKFGNNDEVSDEKDAIIQRLALENENLRKQVKSSETNKKE